jgi:hypothetical protein
MTAEELNPLESQSAQFEQTSVASEHEINEKNWRREKVWELKAKGLSHRDILTVLKGKDPLLKISLGTITNDLKEKQAEIDRAYQQYIENDLPYQHNLALTNLRAVVREAWLIVSAAKTDGDKIQALRTVTAAQAAIDELMSDPATIQHALTTSVKLKKSLQTEKSA